VEAKPAEVTSQPSPTTTGPTYSGNNSDLVALAAAIGGLSILSTCFLSYLAYCMPLALGVAGLALAKEAAHPQRARVMSFIGLGSSLLVILIIFTCIALYIAVIVAAGVLGSR